jgi:hypothetical protein
MTHRTAKSVSVRSEALQAAKRKYVLTVRRYDKIWSFTELQVFCILYVKLDNTVELIYDNTA